MMNKHPIQIEVKKNYLPIIYDPQKQQMLHKTKIVHLTSRIIVLSV